MTKRFSLDGTQLKFLALLFMLIDHIHYFFEFTGAIPEVFFIIGRLSAYLFLFCMINAVGEHTLYLFGASSQEVWSVLSLILWVCGFTYNIIKS